MSILDRADKLDAAATAFEEAANTAFARADPVWSDFTADLGEATSRKTRVGYVEDGAELRVLPEGAEREWDSLGRAYEVEYELETIYKASKLALNDIDFDHSGRIQSALNGLLESGQYITGRRIWARLTANPVGLDGVSLLSTAHPYGEDGATQSNRTTDDLGYDSYNAARIAMGTLKRENGEALDFVPTHLYVPPALERLAIEIAGPTRPLSVDSNGDFGATSSVVGAIPMNNVYQGQQLTVVKSRYFTADTDYLFMDLSRAMYRPWAAAFGQRPEGRIVTDLNDKDIRDSEMVPAWVQAKIAHGPAHWQTVWGRLS